MLDINGVDIREGRVGQLLVQVVKIDPATGIHVRILNSEYDLVVGCREDEALGGFVADSEFAMLTNSATDC
jgi:hypothetical protein